MQEVLGGEELPGQVLFSERGSDHKQGSPALAGHTWTHAAQDAGSSGGRPGLAKRTRHPPVQLPDANPGDNEAKRLNTLRKRRQVGGSSTQSCYLLFSFFFVLDDTFFICQ